jgi:gluconolactonase
MTIEIRDKRLPAVTGESVKFERLATGFAFTEGPVWHPYQRWLIFSDIPSNRLHRWLPSGELAVHRAPSNMANGNTFDRQGRLVSCEHATSQVTRTEPNGTMTVLASHHGGKALNSPNDIVVATDGAIYFTDPTYGRMDYVGVKRDVELAFRGVYRFAPDSGALTLLADDFAQPNGLCLSLDETRLFINDTERRHIRVFTVASDGTVSGGAVWATATGDGAGAPDGMKIDSGGNLYCTGPGGIHVFAPEGACLGVIRTPEQAANFTFGEDDLRSLFITASTSLYRIRVAVPGLRVF